MDAEERQAVLYTLSEKRETGKQITEEHGIELDLEAAEAAWPNFKVFYDTFKGHPSLGPGSVEDSTTLSLHTEAKEGDLQESESDFFGAFKGEDNKC